MSPAAAARQLSAGLIVGLSSVIYAISYGALLFAGPLAPFLGFGITIALLTAIVGALFSWVAEESTFVIGPDSNTTSVMASILAGLGTLGFAGPLALNLAATTIMVTSLVAAGAFYAIGRARLSALARYIPFSVMAGFLCSTGWLMCSGALNIISGTPLSLVGLQTFLANPVHPEIAFGALVAVVLFALSPRISNAILIPLMMLITTAAVNLFLRSGVCTAPACSTDAWLFAAMSEAQWLPPWRIDLALWDLDFVFQSLPAMLVVAFVGLLTILLSVASLELTYRKEFDLDRMLKVQAFSAAATALFGGFVGVISVGRTTLNKTTGGGAVASTIAAGICLATLFGAAQIISYVPRASLGGLVLYLGLGMLKQWLWDQRRATSPIEFAQIVLILVLVANFGFMVGFSAGLLISCVVFVVTYSRVPLADLATNLSLFASSVVRPEHEMECLRTHGHKTLLYRLSGYVFFGSASKIETVFRAMDDSIEAVVIDFTRVSGVDSSAISVFQRILRRYHGKATVFHFACSPENEDGIRAIARDAATAAQVQFHGALDRAVEVAEDGIIAQWGTGPATVEPLAFLGSSGNQDTFLTYCELRQIKHGAQLCAELDISDEIFFIAKGSLEVVKSSAAGTVRLAKLHQGAMVGELAFYTGEARTASIVAVTDAEVYVLHKTDLARLREECPDLAVTFDHMVIRKVSHALTRTNKLVAMYR